MRAGDHRLRRGDEDDLAREASRSAIVIRMSDESAVLATYFRNNVLHLFAMPSLLACAFGSNSVLRTEDLQRLAWRIYPYIASELVPALERRASLPRWSTACSRRSQSHGLIERGPRAAGMAPPGSGIGAGRAALAARAGHHPDHRALLPGCRAAAQGRQRRRSRRRRSSRRCQLMAQRITMLYGFNSPEFFDRSLFEPLHRPAAQPRRDPRVARGQARIRRRAAPGRPDAQLVLNEQIRHSILQVTHA